MPSFKYRMLLLVVFVAIVELRATTISAPNLTVLESLPGVPPGWREGAAVLPSKRLMFRIAIRQEDAFAFEQQVIAISTPDHPLYGQHMDQQEVRRLLQPSPKASRAVLQWLDGEGVPPSSIKDDGGWISFHVSAGEAERILATEFRYYSHAMNQIESIRTLRYSVPERLHKYIQLIQPTTRFNHIGTEYSTLSNHFATTSVEKPYSQSTGLDVTSCNTTITPECLRDLYHVGEYQGKVVEGMSKPFFSVCSHL